MIARRKKPRKRSMWRKSAPIPVGGPEVAVMAEDLALQALCLRERRAWVHAQPCIIGEHSPDPCAGRVQAAHQDYGKAMGKKVDLPEIPACERHHSLLGNDVHGTSIQVAGSYLRFLVRLVMRLALALSDLRYRTGAR